MTNVTQGSIQKQFGTIKRDNGDKAMYPAQYANSMVNNVITSCHVAKLIIKQSKKNKSKFFIIF